jgi:hypothetical protein
MSYKQERFTDLTLYKKLNIPTENGNNFIEGERSSYQGNNELQAREIYRLDFI